MAGAMRKVGLYLGLLEGSDKYDDEYDDVEESAGSTGDGELKEPRGGRGSVATLAPRRKAGVEIAEASRIITLTPSTYNEARAIGEHFRDGVPVIMNLTEMDDDDAKRLVDFAAGLIFGMRGSIERVTSKVFLLSPPNVTVGAAEKQRIADGGFFNQS